MRAPSNAELVCLLLAETDDGGRSPAAIGEALGMAETVAGRIELVAALRECLDSGLVGVTTGSLADGDTATLAVMPAGEQRAVTLRSDLAGETVSVSRDGTRREVPIGDLDDELEVPLARALSHMADGVVRLPAPDTEQFVDRDAALATLTDHLDAVEGGTARTVVLTGEHGIGKSTLADALLDRARDRGIEVLAGSGQGVSGQPYQGFRTALADRQGEAPARLFEGGDVPDPEHARERRQSFFSEVTDYLADLAAAAPVLLLVDHLEAADPATVALFDHLAADLETAPVLLLGAVEPEALPPDHQFRTGDPHAPDPAATLPLERFDRETVAAYVERRLGDPSVPAAFVDAMFERTGGNPLFLDASLTYLLAEGLIDPRTGFYPSGVATRDVPDQVQSVILQRVEGLDDDARTVLDCASVVGDTVDRTVLETMLAEVAEGFDEADRTAGGEAVKAAIRRIERLGIWRLPDADTLRFTSGVVRSVIHDRIDAAVRQDRHETVARVLEQVHGDDFDAHAADAADQYSAAGRPRKAIECYRRAGEHAAGVYAHEAAVEAYEQALEIAIESDFDDAALALRESLGEVHLQAEHFEEADRYLRYVADRSDRLSTRREIAARRARISTERGDLEGTVEVVDQALADWDGETDSQPVAALLNRKAWAVSQLGEQEEGRELAERALAMGERLDAPKLAAQAHRTLGVVEYQYGDAREAVDRYERQAAAAEAAGADRLLAAAYNNLAGATQLQGDLEAAEEYLRRARDQYEAIDNRVNAAVTISNLGYLNTQTGNLETARENLDEAIGLAQRFELEVYLAYGHTFRGELELVGGNLEAAATDLEAAIEWAEGIGHDRSRHRAMLQQIRVRRLQDDLDGALALAEAVLETADEGETDVRGPAGFRRGQLLRETGNLDEAIAVHESFLEATGPGDPWRLAVMQRIGLAAALLERGRVEEALEHARAALETADPTGNRLLPMDARAAMATARAAAGDVATAEKLLEEALVTARDVGSPPYEWRLEIARGQLLLETDPTSARRTLETARKGAADDGIPLHERRAREALAAIADADD